MSQIISEFRQKFSEADKTFGDISHPVWSGGEGKPIILMHELDGFAPAFIQLALRMSKHFTVHAPVFYGEVGQSFNSLFGFARAYFCMRREFEVFRLGRTSPIASWVRELAEDIHKQSPAFNGVGVVGMCMTGGIVLATISHSSVLAGVAAQPSLPLARCGTRRRKEDLGMSSHDIESAAQSGIPVLVLRYGRDRICPDLRIPSVSRQIPSTTGPPEFLKGIKSHSTLTDLYRSGTNQDIQTVCDRAIKKSISFLNKHL